MTIEVSDEDVDAVEDEVGMGSSAWECEDPKKIIAAAYEVMRRKEEQLNSPQHIAESCKREVETWPKWKQNIDLTEGMIPSD
jgi:hypothetical protein